MGNLSLFATNAGTSAGLWAFGWRLTGSPCALGSEPPPLPFTAPWTPDRLS